MFGKIVHRKVHNPNKKVFGEETVRYRVRVRRDYKDNLGRFFTFRSTLESAACGVDFERGRRFGALLYRFNGKWSVSSCSVRSRAYLEGDSTDAFAASACAQALA